MSIPIDRNDRSPSDTQRSRDLASSFKSQHGERMMASIAEESICYDLVDEETAELIEDQTPENILSRTISRDTIHRQHSLLGTHRRTSYTTSGPRPFLGLHQTAPDVIPTEQDREEAINEERNLLQDNNIIPPDTLRRRGSQASRSSRTGLKRRLSFPTFSISRQSTGAGLDEESGPSESTALLSNDVSSGPPSLPDQGKDDAEIEQKWEDAVLAGKIQTTWRREFRVLVTYSAPLILTFLLQSSLTITSIFTVGHIGKNELGAVSLGGMTAAITGYCVYIGLATSLDTLCAQAYGSGRKKLVGLNLQRMVFFLWACTIPIAVVWFFSEDILVRIVPEKEVAVLAGQYLRILILGAPAYACFESSKRYVQAQGKFAATMYVLLIAAPMNVLMHWLFVWHFGWGFVGCPIAIVVTEYLMVLLLFLYVRFVGGLECWPGFSRKAFKNWGPMIRLALPGFVMVVAEFMAFEIITFASAQISSTHLAANAVLQSCGILAYQLPFPLSIAASTRVANLIGATLPDAAKVTTRVQFVLGAILGAFNVIMLSSLRFYIPRLFTSEPEVIDLAAKVLPVNAAFQLFDALAAQCNGVLRGLGKQRVGGYVSLLAFYGIAIPISFGTAFGLHWDLYGLWAGPAVALFIQFVLEAVFIYKTSWQKASEEAARRNAAG